MAEVISGKVALVTGGSKGIGYSIAESLIQEGMKVVITSRTATEVEQAAQQLNTVSADSAVGVVADVRNPEDLEASVQAAIDRWRRLDVLIANAGIGHFSSIEDMSLQHWKDVIDINLTGVFNSIKACLPALKSSKGYIITIASLAGTNFFAGGAAYNASKFGLVGFTQAVMLDLRQKGIKVSTIMPGSVSTYFNGRTPSEAEAWKIQPEDLGQITVDLLKMHPRTLPSKVEVRPSVPPQH